MMVFPGAFAGVFSALLRYQPFLYGAPKLTWNNGLVLILHIVAFPFDGGVDLFCQVIAGGGFQNVTVAAIDLVSENGGNVAVTEVSADT